MIVSGSEEQCGSDDDCSARGFENATCADGVCVKKAAEEDPIWGCLGHVVEPVPDPSKTISFPMRLAFANGGSPVGVNAVVDVCDKLDLDCTSVDPNFPKGLHPDSAGMVDVVVQEGFDGFVRITSNEVVDSRVYVGRPIVTPPSVKEIQLLRPTEYELLATLTGKAIDPTRGTAIVLAVDCQGIAASGVRFEVPSADSESDEFYLINQAPTMPPTATSTDKDGFGGFFNLKPDYAVVRAYRAEDEVFIGESSFQILANTISYVQVAPTPQ